MSSASSATREVALLPRELAPLRPRRAQAGRRAVHAAARRSSRRRRVRRRRTRRSTRRGGASRAPAGALELGAEPGFPGTVAAFGLRPRKRVARRPATGRKVSPSASARSIGTSGSARHSSPGARAGARTTRRRRPRAGGPPRPSGSPSRCRAPRCLVQDRAERRRGARRVVWPAPRRSARPTSQAAEIAHVEELHRPLRGRGSDRRPAGGEPGAPPGVAVERVARPDDDARRGRAPRVAEDVLDDALAGRLAGAVVVVVRLVEGRRVLRRAARANEAYARTEEM